MVMPLNLIFVRHGESEGNVANRQSRKGDNNYFDNREFQARHSSRWRLSQNGVVQAAWAGHKIRSYGLKIGRKYTSPYFRAMETMGVMRLSGPPAMAVYEIRERSWGKLDRLTHEERMTRYGDDLLSRNEDPFLWEPPGGEPLVSVVSRVRDFLSTLWHECGCMECVVVVCHAEVMEVVRVVLERMLPQHYVAMKEDATQGLWNCSLLHYTRGNPFSNEASRSDYLRWVRLTTPPEAHGRGEIGFAWKEIVRPTFTDDELLAFVKKHAPQIQY